LKEKRYGATSVRFRQSLAGWYVMVGSFAVCSHHGAPHLHRHKDPGHPEHLPRVPLDESLDMERTLVRVQALCLALPREPTFDELLEALR